MKEGILHEQKGKIFPYDVFAATLYGFDNGYCALCRVAIGGTDPTKKGENPGDIIELSFSGMTVLPKDLAALYDNKVRYLYDSFGDNEVETMLEKFSQERKEEGMEGVDPMKKYDSERKMFEGLNHAEMVKILRDLRELPPRKRIKDAPRQLIGCVYKDSQSTYFPKRDGIIEL